MNASTKARCNSSSVTNNIRIAAVNAGAEPVKMLKRIGSTYYEVSVHFSKTSKETINDKILRLIRNEVSSGRTVEQ